MTEGIEVLDLEPIKRLTRDLKKAAATLSNQEARYLVDSYYRLQEIRKATGNQILALNKSNEPCSVIDWFSENSERLEGQIQRALGAYAAGSKVGRWSQSLVGIGPVISAGLLAHLEMEFWHCGVAKNFEKHCKPEKPCGASCHLIPCNTAGQIWRFAGLDPTIEWKKGEKRPFNATLKVLCWKIGQSFLKFSNHEHCVYGHVLKERWELEKQRNEERKFAEQAAEKLAKFNIGKTTDAYKSYSVGKLPPAHILQRSCRYATKLFLSHWHHVAFESHFGKLPPKPYVFDHVPGHTHFMAPPNWPCE